MWSFLSETYFELQRWLGGHPPGFRYAQSWRRDRDSNPGEAFAPGGLVNRCTRPLCDPSCSKASIVANFAVLSSTVLEVIGGSADKVAIFLGVAVVSNDTLDEAQWNG